MADSTPAQEAKSGASWILVAIVGIFGPVGGFIAAYVLLNFQKRAVGQAVYMLLPFVVGFIPFLNICLFPISVGIALCVWLDLVLLAKHMQEGGSVNEYDHRLEFLGGLPLMKE